MRYIASCSFGKDSMATILLAHKYNEPLDEIIFAEIIFDKKRNISGEHPKHIVWIKNIAIPKLIELIGDVKITILRADKDYLDCFNHIPNGKYYPSAKGFPIGGKCDISKHCKLKPIRDFYKSIKEDVTQYVGIAIDEPKRLKRMHADKSKISLLEKYNYTEQDAYDLCVKHNLLSPIYSEVDTRNGCWFCMNYKIKGLVKFYREYPELWEELRVLGKRTDTMWKGYRWGVTVDKVEQQIIKKLKREEADKRQLCLFDN